MTNESNISAVLLYRQCVIFFAPFLFICYVALFFPPLRAKPPNIFTTQISKDIHPLNHLRFYLSELTFFKTVSHFFFGDDDVLVQKDLGKVLARVKANPHFSDKPIASMCSVWEWDRKCDRFEFRDRVDKITDSTVLCKCWFTPK